MADPVVDLAMTGASTIVAAMATSAWQAARDGVVRLFRGRGDDLPAIEARLDGEVSYVIDQCAAAFAELGDQRALAWALYWQADCAVMDGRRPQALQYAQRGHDIARANQESGAEIMLLRETAITLAYTRGREDESIAYAERALTLARQWGEQTHELDTMRVLAHVNSFSGRHSAPSASPGKASTWQPSRTTSPTAPTSSARSVTPATGWADTRTPSTPSGMPCPHSVTTDYAGTRRSAS